MPTPKPRIKLLGVIAKMNTKQNCYQLTSRQTQLLSLLKSVFILLLLEFLNVWRIDLFNKTILSKS